MSKPVIFISCGQFTEAEKSLGKNIYSMVKGMDMEPFFAEEVQDLQGLDTNILAALSDASGFITVLHPRGKIIRPDGSEHVRASVWIEQEIAIATYIKRAQNRDLPVIAFIHKSVGREGIRDLLQLNPIVFTNEMEVLAALPGRLQTWGTLKPIGIVPVIKTDVPIQKPDGHLIGRMTFHLANNTSHRITQLSGTVKVPIGILKHWTNRYGFDEEHSTDGRYRLFRFDETRITMPIQPQTTGFITYFDYCITCGIQDTGEVPHLGGLFVSEREVEMKVWIDGREYRALTTMKDLLQVARGS
jgi:hypothetical protein